MNIMSKVTLRQMVKNRRRTIVTIIGVIISVAMFTAVATLSGSFLNFMQRTAIESSGDYHIHYLNVPSQNIDVLADDENTDSYYVVDREGLTPLNNAFGAKRFLSIQAITPEEMKQAGVNLTEGKYPENDHELVLSQNVKERTENTYQIGDQVTLPLGERIQTIEGNRVMGDSEVYQSQNESFRQTDTKTYTIVGFATVFPLEPSWAPYYTAVTGINPQETSETVDVYVKLKNLDFSIYDAAAQLRHEAGASDYEANTSLLFYSGLNPDQGFMTEIYALVIVLFIIIFVGSVALIYNAFAISVTERSTNFGLLSSIGATKRQKRQAVLFEAGIIALISLPFGIAGGLLGMQAVFMAVNPVVDSLMAQGYSLNGNPIGGLQVTVSPWAMGISILLSLVTVFVSAWIPARRASRISPIEAIRQTKDVKLTPRAVKTSWLTRKLFGFEGEIAMKNLKRNKKRYRVAISSFIISLVLFLSASSFTYYLGNAVNMATETSNYDIVVQLQTSVRSDGTGKEELKELEQKIRQTQGVETSTVMTTWEATPDVKYTNNIQQILGEANLSQSGVEPYLQIHALDDESLRAYCEKVGVDYETMQNTETPSAILVNDIILKNGNTYTATSIFDVKQGDTLGYQYTQYTYSNTSENTTQQNQKGAFRLQAITGEVVPGIVSTRLQNELLWADAIVSEKVYDTLFAVQNSPYSKEIYISAKDPAALTDKLTDLYETTYLSDSDISIFVYDLTSSNRMIGQMLFLINTFSYVFIALISAIGVANIFNTISTSIILRKREFAMLKSVGMTPNSFNKMIWFESLLYGLKSLLWGLPLSFGVMALIYLMLKNNFNLPFSVPWLQVGIGIVAIFVIVVATMFYATRKIKKENIVEGLRNNTF